MNEEKKNKKELKSKEKAATPLSVAVGGSLLEGSIKEATESLKQSTSLQRAITDFSSLSTKISEACGGVSDIQALATPLSGKALWGQIDKAKSSLANVVLGNNWQNVFDTDSIAGISKLSDIRAATSLWSIDKALLPDDYSKAYSTPSLSALGALERQTSLLAKDYGLSHITSVASQISTITGMFSQQALSVKELIAPSTMLSDLETLALSTHRSFVDVGSVSEWQLGIVDSASYLVDRQVDWASQLCKTVYDEKPFTYLEGQDIATPKLNFISWLPIDLEVEKKKNQDIKPNEALEKSTLYRLSEKGKRLINKIVTINQLCERSQKKPIFKYSGGTMKAAATMGGTYCSTKEALGEIIDGLYMIFYENLEHIKEYVSDGAVRSDELFQCIFRVKDIRTDYRHDNNHGGESKIRKKELEIGESYSHYVGKPVLLSSNDYLKTQDMLFDEFDELADYMIDVVSKSIS